MKTDETCSYCGGAGWVRHPEWLEYDIAWNEAAKRGENLHWMMFFHEKGYWVDEDYVCNVPPQEIRCPQCNGRGRAGGANGCAFRE
jgi:hypothetical protein